MGADRLKNGTVAKVAMHAAELYQQALVQAEAVRSSGTVEHFAFADVSSIIDFFLVDLTLLWLKKKKKKKKKKKDTRKQPRHPDGGE